MFDAIFPKHWTTLQRLMWLKTNALARAVYETITGNPVSFTAKAAPLRQLKVAFSPVQEGSGDPSPDNVRPISGWSSLSVEQRGVNLWDEETESGYIRANDGEPVPDSNKIRMKNYIPVLPNTTYYKHCGKNTDGTPSQFWNVYFDSNKQYISYGNPSSGTFTTPANCYYIRSGFETAYGTTYNHDISINYPSTDTSYHAYNPSSRSISISLGETVYSGTVDVVTGVVTVDMAKIKASEVAWTGTQALTDGTGYLVYKAGVFSPTATGKTVLCNNRKRDESSKQWELMTFGEYKATTYLIVTVPPEVNTAAKAQTYFANNESEFVYELATPIPISLTPQEVNSLAGDNTMWSNANQPITVEYRKN